MANKPIGMILSAGFGTRLYPLNQLLPKPLMEVGTKPILHLLIAMMHKAGIDDIVINLHYMPEQIRRSLRELPSKVRLHLSYEKEILGTAGGLRQALSRFGFIKHPMLLVHGDIFCDLDLRTYFNDLDFYTLICARNHAVDGYEGGVAIDSDGYINELGAFYRNNRPIVARGFFSGIHYLSTEALRLIALSEESNLVAKLIPTWLREGRKVKGKMLDFRYDDLGTAERVFKMNMAVLNKPKFNFVDLYTELKQQSDQIFVGHQPQIHPSARLKGPLMLADSVCIGANAHVGPYVALGQGARIHEGAKLKHSVVMARTDIEKEEDINFMLALRSARVLIKSTEHLCKP